MVDRMEFHKNAAVVAANGSQVGRLERVVLEPKARTVTHLVVRIGALFNKVDKLVPTGKVGETNPEQIVLQPEAGELNSAPAFEEARVVAGTEPEPGVPPVQAVPTPTAFGAPIMGAPLPPASEAYETRVEQNIPEGTVALKEGAKVVSVEGKALGSVEAVISQAPGDHVTHLLVSSGLLAKETKLMPMEWVQAVLDDQVQLRIGQEDAFEQLEDERSQ